MSAPHDKPSAWLAPGASSHGVYAPSKGQPLPRIDDHLVKPESREVRVHGETLQTLPARTPHASQHAEIAHLFRGCLAPGYTVAVDMLMRADEDSDIAPDVSVFPSDPDAETGGRKLEELVFEVLDSERMRHATDKVDLYVRRGVRRIFAVRVRERRLLEWSVALDNWTELMEGDLITDPCFVVPIPSRAVVDRVLADDTVARALLALGNPVVEAAIEEGRDEGREEGRQVGREEGRQVGREEGRRAGEMAGILLGKRSMVRTVLEARGWAVDEALRARIDHCEDTAALDRWATRAVTAPTLAVVFDDATRRET